MLACDEVKRIYYLLYNKNFCVVFFLTDELLHENKLLSASLFSLYFPEREREERKRICCWNNIDWWYRIQQERARLDVMT